MTTVRACPGASSTRAAAISCCTGRATSATGSCRYTWTTSYLLAYIVFTTPSHFTLPLGVATFQTQYSQDTARIFAFTALSMVPALGFFVLAERRIVAGLTGSLKA